jgi:hypothetical protein
VRRCRKGEMRAEPSPTQSVGIDSGAQNPEHVGCRANTRAAY